MIPRTALATAHEWSRIFRVVAITGPRQSGKTTLARQAFPDHGYRSLEDPDQRELALSDPRGYLAHLDAGDGVILDEVQRCPDLLSYLQGRVDADPRPGRWILTGSTHLHLVEGITQSLAGRAGLLELTSCSLAELRAAGLMPRDPWEALWRGGFPEPVARSLPPEVWYQAYLASVLERDLRAVVQVRDLERFRRFVALCAGRVGQLVNRSSLGADAGVDASTVDRWLAALQAAHLVFLLRPYHRNFGKRLIKAPKLYFADPALAVALLGIRERTLLPNHPLRGPLFENWVVAELRRSWLGCGERPPLYFWRDRLGNEIDLVCETGGKLHPIEIKSGATVGSDWSAPLQAWRKLAGAEAGTGSVFYGGDEAQPAGEGVQVLPWHAVADDQPVG